MCSNSDWNDPRHSGRDLRHVRRRCSGRCSEDQLIDSMVQASSGAVTTRVVIGVIRGSHDAHSLPMGIAATPLAHQLALFQAATMESHVIRKHRETIMVLLTIVDRIGSSAAEIDQETAASASELLESECRDTVCEILESLVHVLSCIETTRSSRQPRLLEDDLRHMEELIERLEQLAAATSCSPISVADLLGGPHGTGRRPSAGSRAVARAPGRHHLPDGSDAAGRGEIESFDLRAIPENRRAGAAHIHQGEHRGLCHCCSWRRCWGSVGATAVVTVPCAADHRGQRRQVHAVDSGTSATFGIAMAGLGPNTIDVGLLLLFVALRFARSG